ncbi:MAG: hypothetical protein PVH61_31715 [Candidatus Aminicenantes bacterium]
MITQFKILFFFLCINVIAFGVVYVQSQGTVLVPGGTYSQGLNSTGTLEEYESNFNASGLVDTWEPVGGYGFAGDIFSGLNMFWNVFRFLIDGLGMTLEWVGSFIPVANVAFTAIAWILRILTGAMVATLVIEMITGRQFLP